MHKIKTGGKKKISKNKNTPRPRKTANAASQMTSSARAPGTGTKPWDGMLAKETAIRDAKMAEQNLEIAKVIKTGKYILVPDTNVWLGYFIGYKKESLARHTRSFLRGIDWKGIRIPHTIRDEFHDNIGNAEYQKRYKFDKKKVEKSFEAACTKGKIDYTDTKKVIQSKNRTVERLYRDLWDTKSAKAISVMEEWARIKFKLKGRWGSMSALEKKKMVAMGPPYKQRSGRNDMRILGITASLADTNKNTILLTADWDFLPFAEWIRLKSWLGVHLLSPYHPPIMPGRRAKT